MNTITRTTHDSGQPPTVTHHPTMTDTLVEIDRWAHRMRIRGATVEWLTSHELRATDPRRPHPATLTVTVGTDHDT